MTSIDREIIVRETLGVSRSGEFVRTGVPFAQSELASEEGLALLGPDGQVQPVQTSVLGRWPDGTIKWVLVDFVASLPAGGCAVYHIIRPPEPLPLLPFIGIRRSADLMLVETGRSSFAIDTRKFCIRTVAGSRSGDAPLPLSVSLRGRDGEVAATLVTQVLVETEGAIRSTVRIDGSFLVGADELCRFTSRLDFFRNSPLLCLEFTLHNPRAASHPGGLWDLGDPGSLLFRELSLNLGVPQGYHAETVCSPSAGSESVTCHAAAGDLSIYQESSGGANWRSANHRNRNGHVPLTVKGYEIRLGGERFAHGDRATPVVWCGTAGEGVAAVLPRFWQEFPKGMGAGTGGLRIDLFPGRFPDLHELQGGERKTTRVVLDYAAPRACLAWARAPLVAVPSRQAVSHAAVVDEIIPSGHGGEEADLLDQFVPGAEVMLGKRELIDEYGWRNFGEVFADHEAVYHGGEEVFVSHYNNQYDICAGFYRKFLCSGDPGWGELAADLARHVLDIDIYHTDRDREEYNGGLFWHTDHYVAAGLATHRSFSREQLQGKDPRSCGGGPGGEHCYTAGLKLHYYLTGNPDYRDAVIRLAQWMHRTITGPHTLLGAVRNAAVHCRKLRDAMASGIRPAFPRYPLSRGTGNAINTFLDAYELSSDSRYLGYIEELIRGSIHPGDDISARNLANVELSWSYTVLLASVGRFLLRIEPMEGLGAIRDYAQGCLLAYAGWMLEHEYPYLERAELLEYPNETWPAQDLRKAVVFYHASRYARGELRHALLDRGRYFFAVSREELKRHGTSTFARPVALMLQNGWAGAALEAEAAKHPLGESQAEVGSVPTPRIGYVHVAARIWGEFLHAARSSSFEREVAWLRQRCR